MTSPTDVPASVTVNNCHLNLTECLPSTHRRSWPSPLEWALTLSLWRRADREIVAVCFGIHRPAGHVDGRGAWSKLRPWDALLRRICPLLCLKPISNGRFVFRMGARV